MAAVIFEDGKHEPRPKHYSFLSMLDDVATSAVNLSLMTSLNTFKPEVPAAGPSNPRSGNIIVPNRSSSLLMQHLMTPPKRVKALVSESEKTHTRSISHDSQQLSRRLSSNIPDPLSLWDSSSFDNFIDEAFLSPSDKKGKREDTTTGESSKHHSTASTRRNSRPRSVYSISSLHRITPPTSCKAGACTAITRPVTASAVNARERQRSYDPEDDQGHLFQCTPTHRFKLVQTLKDLNKRSGRKRKMTGDHTRRELQSPMESRSLRKETSPNNMQISPQAHGAKDALIIPTQQHETITNPLSENTAIPSATTSTSTATQVIATPTRQKSGNEFECGPLPFGFPVCNTLARSRTNPQHSRTRTSTHGTKKRATTGTIGLSQVSANYNMPSSGSPKRVRKASQDGASSKTMKWRSSSRTSSVRPVSPLVHLVPPSAPPQYPLPRIPKQPRNSRALPQCTFTGVHVVVDEPPRDVDTFKPASLSQPLSNPIHDTVKTVNVYKKSHKTSARPATHEPLSTHMEVRQTASSESDIDEEPEPQALSPLRLRSKRTRRNAQVHELKQRHSKQNLEAPVSKSQRSSHRMSKPLRTKPHNRVDSQTLPKILSRLEQYRSSISKETYSGENLSCSGVLVLVDSNPKSLHGFRAGAVSPDIDFTNPWKKPSAKEKGKMRVNSRLIEIQQLTNRIHPCHKEDPVSPRQTHPPSRGLDKSETFRQAPKNSQHPNSKSRKSLDELHNENLRLNEEIKRMARVYNTMVFARQGLAQTRVKSYSELLEDDRKAASVSRQNSESHRPSQTCATELETLVAQKSIKDAKVPSCPPSSPASMSGVDTAISRPNSPSHRKGSVNSTTSRARKGSDSSLTDPNDYDCLSYSPVTTQSHKMQKLMSESTITIIKATDPSTSVVQKTREEDKKYTTYSMIAV